MRPRAAVAILAVVFAASACTSHPTGGSVRVGDVWYSHWGFVEDVFPEGALREIGPVAETRESIYEGGIAYTVGGIGASILLVIGVDDPKSAGVSYFVVFGPGIETAPPAFCQFFDPGEGPRCPAVPT